jgi:REP element-mobilizing transposase RayT
MPRRPRIDLAGYHHVVNRGVNRSDVFEEDADYEMFLQIVCKACRAYRVTLHDYCLMSNHFHLLVETSGENLSLFMKHINGNYAIYANRKYRRSGHFWQGRFYSRYLVSDDYYYTLIRYIEQNPIEAKLVSRVGEYPYTLGAVIANRQAPIPCALHSKLLAELDYENIQEMIGVALDTEDMAALSELQRQKSVTVDETHRPAYTQMLQVHFKALPRDEAVRAAVGDGYTQAEVARHIGLSRSMVSRICRER